jgi:hypothetical protein
MNPPLPPHSSSHSPYPYQSYSHHPFHHPQMDTNPQDFRAFYPYIPNEVKHRKRTSSAQLKVLESVFKTDTKPNAMLRKELSQQLGMTARGVQVWFQNRRAKEKNRAQKAITAAPGELSSSPLAKTCSSPSSPSSPLQSERSSAAPTELASDASTQSNELSLSSAPSAWPQELYSTPRHNTDPCASHNIRRGSLPVNALMPHEYALPDHSPPLLDHIDHNYRRLSVDDSLGRLRSNPYANVARLRNTSASNNVLSISRQNQRGYPFYGGRPQLCRGATMPHDSRRFSVDVLGSSTSPSPSPSSPYHPSASLPDNNLYSGSTRPMRLRSLPGPLPTPNFSFGNPSTTPPNAAIEEHVDPLCNSNGHGYDLEEEPATPYHYSRFGSITSIATSETGTSACYSDVSGYPECNPSRRGSEASGLYNMMGELNVNREQDYLPHEPQSQEGGTHFPTPSPTVSPSGSPPSHEGYQTGQPNALTYALSNMPSMPEIDNSSVNGPSTSEPNSDSLFPSGYSMIAQNHTSLPHLHPGSAPYVIAHGEGVAYHTQAVYPLEGTPFQQHQVSYGPTEVPPFFNDGGAKDERSLSALLDMRATTPYGPSSDHSSSSLTSSVESFSNFP